MKILSFLHKWKCSYVNAIGQNKMKQYAQMILTYKINLNLDQHFPPKGFKNINCKKQGAFEGFKPMLVS